MREPFGRSLWVAEGPTVSFFGFPYPRRMAAVRLDDGTRSTISFSEDRSRRERALGLLTRLAVVQKKVTGAWFAGSRR